MTRNKITHEIAKEQRRFVADKGTANARKVKGQVKGSRRVEGKGPANARKVKGQVKGTADVCEVKGQPMQICRL